MGLFSRNKRSAAPVIVQQTNPFACLPITSGVDLVTDKHSAMNIAAVYRCINIISQGIAQLPMEVKTYRAEGYYKVDELDPLNYLLAVAPNSRMTAYEFRQAMVVAMLSDGNAYIYPSFNNDGEVDELILLQSGSVTYDKQMNRYIVNDMFNHIKGTFEAHQIIHIKNISLDGGYTGMSTLAYAAKVLAISANADTDQINTFKSGGTLRGFVSGKGSQTMGFGTVQQDQLQTVGNNIESQLNSGKQIFTMPSDMDFKQISLSPQQYQLLESKKFNVIEICRFFGVPPDKVFDGQASNYKSSEMSQVAFLTDTLQPILRNIELAFACKLIPRELATTTRIEFNIDSLMQTDLQTQAAYMEKTIAIGVRSVNDWRKHTGKAPVDGGDKILVSANLVPIDSAKLYGESQK